MKQSPARRYALATIKWLISGGIIAYLVWRATSEGTFDPLFDRPKNWWALSAAMLLLLGCVVLNATRWWMLVRCLQFPLRWFAAVRFTMMGLIVSTFSIGVAGEDLFKALFLSHRHGRGRRTEAFATVLVDRVIGTFGLFALAALGVLLNGTWRNEFGATIAYISRFMLAASGISTAVIGLILSPMVVDTRSAEVTRRVPMVGNILRNLLIAFIDYRNRIAALALAVVLALCVHLGVTLVMYLLALGLNVPPASLLSHLVIVPLAFLVLLVPLPLSGLGALEITFGYLYRHIGGCEHGLLIVLGYRAIFLGILAISALVFAARGSEADQILHEVKEIEEER